MRFSLCNIKTFWGVNLGCPAGRCRRRFEASAHGSWSRKWWDIMPSNHRGSGYRTYTKSIWQLGMDIILDVTGKTKSPVALHMNVAFFRGFEMLNKKKGGRLPFHTSATCGSHLDVQFGGLIAESLQLRFRRCSWCGMVDLHRFQIHHQGMHSSIVRATAGLMVSATEFLACLARSGLIPVSVNLIRMTKYPVKMPLYAFVQRQHSQRPEEM